LCHQHANINDGIAFKHLKQQFGNLKLTTNTNVAAASGAQNHVEDEEIVRVAEDSTIPRHATDRMAIPFTPHSSLTYRRCDFWWNSHHFVGTV